MLESRVVVSEASKFLLACVLIHCQPKTSRGSFACLWSSLSPPHSSLGALPSELSCLSLPSLSAPPLQLRVHPASPGFSLPKHVDFEMPLNHPSGDSLKCFLEESLLTPQTSRVQGESDSGASPTQCNVACQVIALTFGI